MKHSLFSYVLLGLLLACHALAARADGEERNEQGTKWVDPVEFYHLQDVHRSDYQRSYDQGDIDFNKEIAAKGVKVYGLRLKPIAAAVWVEKLAHHTWLCDEGYGSSIGYQDLYGIRGVPLHEASFCVYMDEGVSRTYSFTYDLQGEKEHSHRSEKASNSMSINGLRLITSGEGLGFSYTLSGKAVHQVHKTYKDDRSPEDDTDNFGVSYTSNGNSRYGHFIYFTGARDLLVMLSAPDAQGHGYDKWVSYPWPRVYYIVEEILVESKAAAIEEAAITGEDPAPEDMQDVPELSQESKQELKDYMQDLVDWLDNAGDYLGLGEHSDEKESAVINTIATIISMFLGTGLAGVLGGGTGASIASGLTNSIISGTGVPAPPPAPGSAPSSPDLPNLRRPEDEDGDLHMKDPVTGKETIYTDNGDGTYRNLTTGQDWTPAELNERLRYRDKNSGVLKQDADQAAPPAPPESSLDFFDKYVRTDEDGDLHMKDPVTGKETIYTDNGDGTYRNLTTGQDWTPAELNERLRYRDENSGVLKQDADQAARNAAEQHAQWEKESQTLSQDGQDYLKWKHEQEAAERKQEQVKKLAEKYGVSPDERIVRNTIRHEQELNQIDSELNKEESDILESKEKYLETVDKTCEIGVNVMSNFVPGGNHVKDVYTFAKSTLVATSEAIADGKSAGAAVGHVMVGITDGALGVIQNRAGDLAGKGPNALGKEYGITILTENLKEGMKELYKTGDFSKAGTAMINATGKKTADFGFGKALGYGMGKLKDAAGQGKLGEGTSKMIDKWFNQKHSFHAGQRAEVYRIGHESIKTGDFKWGVSKGAGFSKFYSGTVDFGKVTEGVINEGMNQTGMHDWAGRMATGVTGKVSEIAGEVAYDVSDSAHDVARIAGEFAQKVTQLSDMAANYRKS